MVSPETFKQIALSFPEANEQPHFEKTSFRVNKKIFATLDMKLNRACLKFSEVDQDVFSAADRSVIYPVPNAWGKQGWTLIELDKVHPDLFEDALKTSYRHVAPAKLAALIK